MADYDIDDDGFAVSEQIWRFSGHVNPHTDDQTSDYVIVGFVFDANGHKRAPMCVCRRADCGGGCIKRKK